MLFRRGDIVSRIRRRRESVAVAVLLLVALALRLYQVNWDQGHLYHPDERFILMSAQALQLTWPFTLSQLVGPQATLIPKDYSYSYGTLALYLVRIVNWLLIEVGQVFPFIHWFDNLSDLGNLRLVGRPLSALFDTASVYMVYRLGRQLYGWRVGMLAAGLLAFSVIDIQLSHFYATDTMMSALVLATIVASVEFLRRGKTSSIVFAGIFCGLALATKASAAVVLAPFLAAHVMRTFLVEDPEQGVRLRLPSSRALEQATEGLVLGIVFAALTFLIAEPYALIDTKHFLQGIFDQSDMVRGTADLPYTRQYFGRPPYLYFIQNLLLFGVGLPLGIAMLAGWAYVIIRNVIRPRLADLLILVYVVPYFAITGDFWAKFMRYLLPITPLLVVFAALGLIRLIDLARGWRLGLYPDLAFVPAPTTLKLPPELISDRYPDDPDLFDLERFDGHDELPESPESTSGLSRSFDRVEDDGPGQVALDRPAHPSGATNGVAALDPIGSSPGVYESLEPDLARFAELKGFSLDWLTDSVDESPAVDPEAARFAQIKGLSLDWFAESEDAEELAPVAARSTAEPAPIEEWVEIPVVPDEAEADPSPRPLPDWLDRRPALAHFFAGRGPTWIARGLAAVVVAFTMFYGLAFDHMYDRPSPPVAASAWLYQNAPRGAVLATEHWEEGMPVPLPTANGGVEDAGSQGYRIVTMPMYDDDNSQKLNTIVDNLEQADFVVFFSNRLYGTVTRIPGRYPMSHRYYDALFGEKLGFKLVDVGERYPNLLGVAFVDDTLSDPGLTVPALIRSDRIAPITINLGHADESFSVYDHQRVLIFKKEQKLTPGQLRTLIGPPSSTQLTPTGQAPQYKSLMLTSAQEAAVQLGGTFRDIFNRGDLPNQVPLLAWAVVIVLLGLGGFPFAFLALKFLPDRGYLLSRTLGTLLFVWLSWMIVSLGLVEATRPATLAILAAFLVLSAVVGYLQRVEIVRFIRERRRLLVAEEGLFWLAFLYDVWIRSLDPDLWHPALGGEKPMDFAYLNAAIRSPIYPPYDPWFAGGYLNYYYFGQIIVGTVTKVTGVLPAVSYNLAVPFLFALTVAGAFTAALALIHRGHGKPGSRAIFGGVLAALMVCVMGNLGGFLQLVGEVSTQATVQPRSVLPGLTTLLEFVDGALNILIGQHPLVIPEDWYWASTRMLALLNLQGTGSINEFPYFTFLFADLHAHLIALPFTLLVIAFCVNIVKSGGTLAQLPEVRLPSGDLGFAVDTALAAPRTGVETSGAIELLRSKVAWSSVVTIALAGLTVGALYPTNSWDYPTYLGLLGLSLAIPWYVAERRTLGGFATLALRFVAIVALSQLLFRPFYANFQSFYSGVHLSDEKSNLLWYLMIHGLFLVVMLSYFLLDGWSRYRRSGLVRALRLYVGRWELLPRTLELQQVLTRGGGSGSLLFFYGVGALLVVVAALFLVGMQLIGALLALLAIALTFGLRRDRAPEDTFLVFLFATGLALGMGTDLFTIDGDVGRMNTIFKFYEQVWVLFGIGSAVAFVAIVSRLEALRSVSLRRAWIGVIVAFMLMASVYPVLGTISRVSNRFAPLPPTLDGTAFMDHAQYNDDGKVINLASDKAAIVWLQDHVGGTPTILESTRPLYRWGSRISIYTGLPTVIGWDWHQKQQRWGYQYLIDQRTNDVNRMYDDPSTATTLALLRQYGVSYIIDGQLEQGFHPTARAKFDQMVGPSLEVVYDQNNVRIYRVK